MAEKEEWKNETIILRNVRMGFPNLYVPVTNPQYPTQNPSYNAQFEIEKGSDNETLINKAVEKVVKEQHGLKAGKKLIEYKGNKMKYPLKDGDTMEKEWAEGKVFLTAKRQKTLGAPKIIDTGKVDIPAGDDRITNGAVVNVKVVISCQPGVNDGIRCRLEVVQYVKAGESYNTEISTDDFEEIMPEEDEDLV